MIKARLGSRGQITVPRAVRQQLGIEAGDELVFAIEANEVHILPLKRKRLTDLYGVLPATRPYPGMDAIRKEVGEDLGRQMLEQKA